MKNYHREQRAISVALLGSKGRNASHDSQEALMHNLMFITAPKGRRLQRELGEGENKFADILTDHFKVVEILIGCPASIDRTDV